MHGLLLLDLSDVLMEWISPSDPGFGEYIIKAPWISCVFAVVKVSPLALNVYAFGFKARA